MEYIKDHPDIEKCEKTGYPTQASTDATESDLVNSRHYRLLINTLGEKHI